MLFTGRQSIRNLAYYLFTPRTGVTTLQMLGVGLRVWWLRLRRNLVGRILIAPD